MKDSDWLTLLKGINKPKVRTFSTARDIRGAHANDYICGNGINEMKRFALALLCNIKKRIEIVDFASRILVFKKKKYDKGSTEKEFRKFSVVDTELQIISKMTDDGITRKIQQNASNKLYGFVKGRSTSSTIREAVRLTHKVNNQAKTRTNEEVERLKIKCLACLGKVREKIACLKMKK
jgi:hypothetical protein